MTISPNPDSPRSIPGGPQSPYAAYPPPAGPQVIRPEPVSGAYVPPPGPPMVPPQRPGDGGFPHYPTGHGAGRPPSNGLGTTALVLGIIGLLFAFLPLIGVIAWPMVVIGLIFGVLGIARARAGTADNLGVAVSGTVLSALGLIVCVVWVIAFGAAMSSPSPTSTPDASASGGASSAASGSLRSTPGGATSAGAFPGATANDVIGTAGETLTVGDVQVSAAPLRPGDSTFGSTLCSTVTYRNTGSSPDGFNGLFDWKLQDPSGAVLNTGIFGSDNALRSGDLVPGGSTSGDVCFDRAGSAAGTHVLLYDPLGFSSSRGAWLNRIG